MITEAAMPLERAFSPLAAYMRLLRLADHIPLSLVQLVARVAIAHVFWASAQSKLASWPVTIQLFAMEYRLPLIPPQIAATLGTAAELTGSILIFVGLFTRIGALILIGVVAMIQTFVYPENWPDHILWTSGLLLLLARGAGVFSLDHVAKHLFAPRS
ncbi:MAG: DoxX family protein [Acidobacteria bacterium]|nr:MAG: DoxX family protein [Acidobacteriota bacterium]